MRRIFTVLLITTALVATLAATALAGNNAPCIMGCFGAYSVESPSISLR